MTLVVGVDGGGTRTRAVVVDELRGELGRAEGAGAVVTPGATGAVVAAVEHAVRAAAGAAGVTLPVTRLWAALAGAGSREGRLEVTRGLAGRGLAEQVVVGTDVEATFDHAFGRGPGILLIAGTGSIAWGRGRTGEVVRVGGWGERLGDEGSGYAIGLAALRACMRAHDGRGERTALTALVLERLGLDAPEELVDWGAAATKAEVAAQVAAVVEAAERGDLVAKRILDGAVAELETHLAAALEGAGPWPEPPELVLWGGLLQQGGPLREAMERVASSHSVRVGSRPVDPALGAARLALAASEEAR